MSTVTPEKSTSPNAPESTISHRGRVKGPLKSSNFGCQKTFSTACIRKNARYHSFEEVRLFAQITMMQLNSKKGELRWREKIRAFSQAGFVATIDLSESKFRLEKWQMLLRVIHYSSKPSKLHVEFISVFFSLESSHMTWLTTIRTNNVSFC